MGRLTREQGFVDPQIVGQFRVERARPAPTLANQDRLAVDTNVYFDIRSGLRKSGGSDEYTIHPRPGVSAILVRGRHEGIQLRPIGVPLGLDIDETEGRDGMISRDPRQQDRACTGAENRTPCTCELLDRLHEFVPNEPLRDRRALPPGQDQRAGAHEIPRSEHSPPSSAEAFEGGEVFLDVPLDSEDTDDRS